MTDTLAIRIAEALEQIAFNLSDDGPIAEHLLAIRELFEEITPTTGLDKIRYLRTLDIGRD